MKRRVTRRSDYPAIVCISDTHSGCRVALHPKHPIILDGGTPSYPSKLQLAIHDYWEEFWERAVPEMTDGEPFILVHNGDVVDGQHHGSKTQISTNTSDQARIAKALLEPQIEKAEAYYHVRGTEAHVGKSGEAEEEIAKSLGAKPNADGDHARWSLRLQLGPGTIHFTHHIGTTGSSAYESTAIWKEMVEEFVESGRWGDVPANMVVMSHRHRCMTVKGAGAGGARIATVTPAWQAKTPFVHKIPGGRRSEPQFGGIVIRHGKFDGLYVREWVRRPAREPVEVVSV